MTNELYFNLKTHQMEIPFKLDELSQPKSNHKIVFEHKQKLIRLHHLSRESDEKVRGEATSSQHSPVDIWKLLMNVSLGFALEGDFNGSRRKGGGWEDLSILQMD